jgi:hypothetical protein
MFFTKKLTLFILINPRPFIKQVNVTLWGKLGEEIEVSSTPVIALKGVKHVNSKIFGKFNNHESTTFNQLNLRFNFFLIVIFFFVDKPEELISFISFWYIKFVKLKLDIRLEMYVSSVNSLS